MPSTNGVSRAIGNSIFRSLLVLSERWFLKSRNQLYWTSLFALTRARPARTQYSAPGPKVAVVSRCGSSAWLNTFVSTPISVIATKGVNRKGPYWNLAFSEGSDAAVWAAAPHGSRRPSAQTHAAMQRDKTYTFRLFAGLVLGAPRTDPAGAFDDARGGIVERPLLSAAGGAARRDAGADARCRRRAEQPPGRDGTVAVHVRALLDHQIIQLRRAVLKRERTCGADDLAAFAVRLRILYELDQERPRHQAVDRKLRVGVEGGLLRDGVRADIARADGVRVVWLLHLGRAAPADHSILADSR